MEHFERPLNGETLSDMLCQCGSTENYWGAIVFESDSRMAEFYEALQTVLRDDFTFERVTLGVYGDAYLLASKTGGGILEVMSREFFEKVIVAQHFTLNYATILFDTDGYDEPSVTNPALDDFFASLTVADER